jgi:hypothetical protein
METLTQQNVELLHRRLGLSHPEENRDRDEHEEDRNSNTNVLREDDHQEDGSREDNHREQRNGRADRHGDRHEDAKDLSKVIAN